MSDYTLYHNPRCSKSRAVLTLLRERGVEATIRPYLDEPLSTDELATLVKQLGQPVRELLRKSEDEYAARGLGNPDLEEQALLEAVAAAPILMQRPILLHAGRAVIGRPPENVLELL